MVATQGITISVPDDLAQAIDRAVEAGEYASHDDVVLEALHEWGLRRMSGEGLRAELGRLWDAGLASGDAVDADDAFDRIDAEVRRRATP